ncbi:hypothetical protein MMC16_007474 [Acarospora aff. strigata]|nr:hypothetical protein [Acarospora aff. strigata]
MEDDTFLAGYSCVPLKTPPVKTGGQRIYLGTVHYQQFKYDKGILRVMDADNTPVTLSRDKEPFVIPTCESAMWDRRESLKMGVGSPRGATCLDGSIQLWRQPECCQEGNKNTSKSVHEVVPRKGQLGPEPQTPQLDTYVYSNSTSDDRRRVGSNLGDLALQVKRIEIRCTYCETDRAGCDIVNTLMMNQWRNDTTIQQSFGSSLLPDLAPSSQTF